MENIPTTDVLRIIQECVTEGLVVKVFDYMPLYPQGCEFPVPTKGTPLGEGPCGEIALYRGWWGEDDGSDEMYLCHKHFVLVQEKERSK